MTKAACDSTMRLFYFENAVIVLSDINDVDWEGL